MSGKFEMNSVDVAVPCYNYAHFLPACVESVLSQRDVNVRILVIDDCSPDNTAEVAQRIAAADPRVIYSKNEKNLGLVGSANRGVMDWAEAPFTLLLSADDAIVPGALARALKVFAAEPQVAMVYGMGLVAPNNAPQPMADAQEPTYQVLSSETFLERATTIGNPALTPAVVVRTEAQKRMGPYNPDLTYTCDMDMWMRFACEGPIGVIKDVQGLYAEHGHNMSQGFANRSLGDSRYRIKTAESVFAKYGGRFPQSAHWRAIQKRRLVNEAYWIAGQCAIEGDTASVEQCLTFAREQFPNDWWSGAYWRLQLKRVLGKRGAPIFKRNPPSNQARVLGWWPA